MRFKLINKNKIVRQINQLMFEEHEDNQFEESQVMRSYSSGIIDGLGLALSIITKNPQEDGAWAYPISLSFYEEDDPKSYTKHQVEQMRERIFDLQANNKYGVFMEEAN